MPYWKGEYWSPLSGEPLSDEEFMRRDWCSIIGCAGDRRDRKDKSKCSEDVMCTCVCHRKPEDFNSKTEPVGL